MLSPDMARPLLTIRPNDYLRLRPWPKRCFYRVVVNAKGIKLKKARYFQAWGALLGANMSHTLESGDKVLIFGLGFIVEGSRDGGTCTLSEFSDPG